MADLRPKRWTRRDFWPGLPLTIAECSRPALAVSNQLAELLREQVIGLESKEADMEKVMMDRHTPGYPTGYPSCPVTACSESWMDLVKGFYHSSSESAL